MPELQFHISPQHFKTHSYLMDAVIDCFQLAALVYYVFRCGDFAAVVQPGCDSVFAPLVISTQAKVFEGRELRV